MKAVVVYESMFGNTRQIADAIADGLADANEVTVFNVNRVTPADLEFADLVVVGGPTHVHGMSRASSRAEAVKWADDPLKHVTLEPDAPGLGIREWIADPATVLAPLFAAFSTHADVLTILSGSAAAQIDRSARHRASRRVSAPQNFAVTKSDQLRDDDLILARTWGIIIGKEASQLLVTPASTQTEP
ncbi:MAG: hypothetical protein JWQ19_164 [Subtercola sp.]|nr:hypothetical protein [Subtercola sp.]